MHGIAPSAGCTAATLEKRLWSAVDQLQADCGAVSRAGAWPVVLPQAARFAHLLSLPESANVGQAINDAMAEIKKHNPQRAGVLPRTFQIFTRTLLKELLKKVSEIFGHWVPACFDAPATLFPAKSFKFNFNALPGIPSVPSTAAILLRWMRCVPVAAWRGRGCHGIG